MSADTPESVRALIAGYCGYRGAIDWGPMIDMLTRYAESLERGNARIRELEQKIEHIRFSKDPTTYNMLENALVGIGDLRNENATLREQIAAHEKVCAGKYYDVGLDAKQPRGEE
jgi:hypothetical protein